jgi:hypothetical protein
MTGDAGGRVVGVIGTCAAGSCTRAAVRHVEVVRNGNVLVGVVCERCASKTSSAAFLLDLIA